MNRENLKVISKENAVPLDVETPAITAPRDVVHRKGWWHYGIQANLVRLNDRGEIQILVQRRSDIVDISKLKNDQSLATQTLYTDNSPESTFERGLKEELGIEINEIDFFKFLPNASFFIIKRYKENDKLINKEKLSLFVATFKSPRNIHPNSHKVNSLEWVDWNMFVEKVHSSPDEYTKTIRFYIKNKLLRGMLEEQTLDFVKKGERPLLNNKITTIYYSPQNNNDVYINYRSEELENPIKLG